MKATQTTDLIIAGEPIMEKCDPGLISDEG